MAGLFFWGMALDKGDEGQKGWKQAVSDCQVALNALSWSLLQCYFVFIYLLLILLNIIHLVALFLNKFEAIEWAEGAERIPEHFQGIVDKLCYCSWPESWSCSRVIDRTCHKMTPDLFWLTSTRMPSFGTLKIEYACFPSTKKPAPVSIFTLSRIWNCYKYFHDLSDLMPFFLFFLMIT